MICYEPISLAYSLTVLGLGVSSLPVDDTLLYYTMKYILDLCIFKSDVKSALQIALIGHYKDDIIDMYNDGKSLDSPLGYTIENHAQLEKFFEYSRVQIRRFSDVDHLTVSLYFQNKKIRGDEVVVISLDLAMNK